MIIKYSCKDCHKDKLHDPMRCIKGYLTYSCELRSNWLRKGHIHRDLNRGCRQASRETEGRQTSDFRHGRSVTHWHDGKQARGLNWLSERSRNLCWDWNKKLGPGSCKVLEVYMGKCGLYSSRKGIVGMKWPNFRGFFFFFLKYHSSCFRD